MLKVNNLIKKYDRIVAVNDVTFEIENGEIAILLGPNGAGKSTTIKSIVGLLKYEGNILIDSYCNKDIEAKQIFGYVPEEPSTYDLLTVYEHIQFIASAYKLENYEEKAEELLRSFDMWDKRDKLGTELSKGMRQKVSLCCALIINPKVVLFDEPMIGLDPKAIKYLKEIFIELKNNGCSVLISTHIIDSIEEVWDKVLVMNKGKIITTRTRDELEASGETMEEIFFKVIEKKI